MLQDIKMIYQEIINVCGKWKKCLMMILIKKILNLSDKQKTNVLCEYNKILNSKKFLSQIKQKMNILKIQRVLLFIFRDIH